MLLRKLLFALCAVSLSACGSGDWFGREADDGENQSGAQGGVQGIWDGTLTSSIFFASVLVTPANELWAVSWNDNFNQVGQLTRASGTLSGRTLSGSSNTFASGSAGGVSAGQLSGRAGDSVFDGNLGQNVTFTTTYQNAYDQAYDPAAYAGVWRGRDSTGAAVALTIETNGSFSAQSQIIEQPEDCEISGSLSRASSGKNFATTGFSVGLAYCPAVIAGAQMQGVAFIVNKAGQEPLLFIAGTDSGQTAAWFAYARKDQQ